jgi:AraC family transcriptional activator of tynA and feaB
MQPKKEPGKANVGIAGREIAILHWTTDAVPQRQRLEYWTKAISETMFDMRTTTDDVRDFRCSLEVASIDGVVTTLAQGSRQSTFRTQNSLNKSSEHSYHLIADLSKSWILAWDGNHIRMLPGDLCLVDSRFIFGGFFLDSCYVINLKFRPEWLLGWLRDPSELVGRRIDCKSGWGTVLSEFVAQLTPTVIAASKIAPRVVSDQLGSLLSLIESQFESADSFNNTAENRRKVASVVDLIRQRAGEPDLDAEAIAGSLRVPASTMNSWLTRSGLAFGSLLQKQRIEIASEMLASRRFDRLSAAAVGRRVGIENSAQFSNLLRQHIGESPLEFRRATRHAQTFEEC